MGDDADVWYDEYVQLDDDAVVVYAGERGQAKTKIVDTTTDVTSSTDRIQFTVENLGANGSKFPFPTGSGHVNLIFHPRRSSLVHQSHRCQKK